MHPRPYGIQREIEPMKKIEEDEELISCVQKNHNELSLWGKHNEQDRLLELITIMWDLSTIILALTKVIVKNPW